MSLSLVALDQQHTSRGLFVESWRDLHAHPAHVLEKMLVIYIYVCLCLI